jgi:hypothetical protein
MKLSLFSVRIICLIFFVPFISCSVMAQKKNNPDTLDIDHLNPDMHKAIAMRKAGIIITFTGIGIFAAGGITSLIMAANPPDDPDEDPWDGLIDLVPVALGGLTGIACIVVGVPLKAIGESRINAKAKLSLKTFDIVPNCSMALGLGMTLMF